MDLWVRFDKGCVKSESERGLYSKSFKDVGDAETKAARSLMVIEVKLVMWISCREVAVREIVIRSSSVMGGRFKSPNIFNLVIREKFSDGRRLFLVW